MSSDTIYFRHAHGASWLALILLSSLLASPAAPARAANDLSGDVIPGSPVVNFENFNDLRVNLTPYATPATGAAPLGFPTDLVFDANGRGYLAQLTGSVRLIETDGTLAADPVILSTDYTDLPSGRDLGMTSVALHPDFLNAATPGYGKIYTVESGIDHLQGIQNGDPAGVNRLDPNVADFAPTYIPTSSVDQRFKANTNHRSGVFEYTVNPLNPAAGFTAKREVLLTHQHHHAHNLSDLLFDPRATPGTPDYGLLFIGNADSGNGSGYQNNANGPAGTPGPNGAPDSVYGRILRIDPLDPNAPGVNHNNRATFFGTDPDDRDDDLAKFSVPTGPVANPFFTDNGSVTGDDLTWAYGLRNPYRLYIDPFEPTTSTTIWSSETGQKNVEGIRTITAGSDGGWGMLEGAFFYLQNSDNASTIPTLIQGLTQTQLQNLTITVAQGANASTTRPLGNPEINRILGVDFPEFQYDHTDGVSPMGGLIYRGQKLHELGGMLLFAEYQGNEDSQLTDPDGRTIGDQGVLLAALPGDSLGRIFALSTTLGSADVPERILGFATGPDGEPLVFGFNFGALGPQGVIYRIAPGSRTIPEPAMLALTLTLALPAVRHRRA